MVEGGFLDPNLPKSPGAQACFAGIGTLQVKHCYSNAKNMGEVAWLRRSRMTSNAASNQNQDGNAFKLQIADLGVE